MNVLFSKTGSKGNASIITDGNTFIQIDAGIQPDKVNREINYRLSKVVGVLVSHGHGDHAAYIDRYIKLGIKVYANEDVWSKTALSRPMRNAVTIKAGEQFKLGTFVVKPFNVAHVNSDGTDCPNLGFLIYSTVTKEKLLWATDASYIENRFPPVEHICIECNYLDIDDYLDELEYLNGFVEKRRVRSHLSLNRCVDFLKQQDLSRVKEVRLLHLTESQGEIYTVINNRMNKEFPGVKFVI